MPSRLRLEPLNDRGIEISDEYLGHGLLLVRECRAIRMIACALRRGRKSGPAAYPSTSRANVAASTWAPAARSSGVVNSDSWWLTPAADGTKIIALGHTAFSGIESWPATVLSRSGAERPAFAAA